MGARTPRVDRRSRLNRTPITAAAMTRATLPVAAVTTTYTMVVAMAGRCGSSRGVECAAEEQFLAGPVDERDEQYEGRGAGIGGSQHAVEGGADEGQVAGDQVGGEERPERCYAGHDGSDEGAPRHVSVGLERDRSGDERSDRPRGRHQQAEDGEPRRAVGHAQCGRQ